MSVFYAKGGVMLTTRGWQGQWMQIQFHHITQWTEKLIRYLQMEKRWLTFVNQRDMVWLTNVVLNGA